MVYFTVYKKNYSMALREAKKLAEEKKRERLEEKRARYVATQYIAIILLIIRERVRQQIAKDKAEREAALKKGKEPTVQQQQKPSQPAAAVAAPVKKEYDTCRLQVCIVNIKYSFLRCYYRSDCLEVVLSFIHSRPQIL